MSDRQPPSAVYSVGPTGFVFGLDWMAAAATRSASLRAVAGAMGSRATHIAWRPQLRQIGLATISGQKPPSPINPWRSAAAALADRSTRSLLAAFAFADGSIWVVATDKGRIYPDGDRLFTSDSAASLHFRNFLEQRRWTTLYAPPHWRIAEAEEVDLVKLLYGGRDPVAGGSLLARLALTQRHGCAVERIATGAIVGKYLLTALGCSAALALATAGYWFFLHQRPVPRPAAATFAPLQPSYPAIVPARDFLRRCLKSLPGMLAHAETPGWQITGTACSPDGLSISQTAKNYVRPSSMRLFHPDAAVLERSATLARPLTDLPPPVPLTLPLSPPEFYHKALARLHEVTGALATLQQPTRPAGQGRPQPYREAVWTVDTDAPPSVWAEDLAKLPNLTVGTVTQVPKGSGFSWKIKGVIYVAE